MAVSQQGGSQTRYLTLAPQKEEAIQTELGSDKEGMCNGTNAYDLLLPVDGSVSTAVPHTLAADEKE